MFCLGQREKLIETRKHYSTNAMTDICRFTTGEIDETKQFYHRAKSAASSRRSWGGRRNGRGKMREGPAHSRSRGRRGRRERREKSSDWKETKEEKESDRRNAGNDRRKLLTALWTLLARDTWMERNI